ncbi:MAG: aldehyde ferredoxin oxidoreductase [Anaerolineales bacterium]|nr:aldehyde ferredoxin oxidoreductase [Anaerolineales bacterium]
MRKYHEIYLNDHRIETTALEGEAIIRAGRYLIARTLLANDIAAVDPLSPDNPLIFSAGPLAGTSFSNANRTSVGCKSPLTGGIKEANGGGTFSYALGQLETAGFTLHGAADDWTVIHFKKDGSIVFDSAQPYLGLGNFDCAAQLHEKYGQKVSLAICGPVGEYQGLLAGIAFSDIDRRPSRLAARGGVGAVMGRKKVKAIVVDMDKIPPLVDRKTVMKSTGIYAKKLRESDAVMTYNKIGTMNMADYTNYMGGLPVRNFTSGQQVDINQETFKMGGDYITELNNARGGNQSHACMPGCVIQCSNIYADVDGNEVVSPVEYETLGLLGTNCGLTDPDDLAALNYIANDLGVDTIETGAMLAVLMEAGLAEFGDIAFMAEALGQIRLGSETGRLYAQGTARVGEHFQVQRVPVIKKQAISAYDPRVIEITGITMMVTAQGADHTAGNVPRMETAGKELDELMAASLSAQMTNAAVDSLGLCVFGNSVTKPNLDFILDTLNSAHGTHLTVDFFDQLGRDTLLMEREFNRRAGFAVADDELPEFFYTEPLYPKNRVARFHAPDVYPIYDRLAAKPEDVTGY